MKFVVLAWLFVLMATCLPSFAQVSEANEAEFFAKQARKLRGGRPDSGDKVRPGSWIVSRVYGAVAGSVKGSVKATKCAFRAIDSSSSEQSPGQWAEDDLDDRCLAAIKKNNDVNPKSYMPPGFPAVSNLAAQTPQKNFAPYSQDFQTSGLRHGYGYGWTNPHVQHVNAYFRSNGTYVHSHWKTVANHTMRDNFSVRGNRNPFTGKMGHIRARY